MFVTVFFGVVSLPWFSLCLSYCRNVLYLWFKCCYDRLSDLLLIPFLTCHTPFSNTYVRYSVLGVVRVPWFTLSKLYLNVGMSCDHDSNVETTTSLCSTCWSHCKLATPLFLHTYVRDSVFCVVGVPWYTLSKHFLNVGMSCDYDSNVETTTSLCSTCWSHCKPATHLFHVLMFVSVFFG